jgi:hypothetical protein
VSSKKKKIPLECGIDDSETRTRTGDTTIFSRVLVSLKVLLSVEVVADHFHIHQ